MDETKRRAVTCPECSRQILAPADRGRLRVTCKSCSHRFEWDPEHTDRASADSFPAPDQPPLHNPNKGIRSLLLSMLILFAIGVLIRVLGLDQLDSPPGWLALGGLIVGILLLFWIYRGVRMLTGLNPVVAFVLASFVSVIPGMLATMAPLENVSGIGDVAANFSRGAPQDSAGGDYFEGLNANNTDAAELDALMEDW